jgi:hypothetical protein
VPEQTPRTTRQVQLLAPGYCLICGHHEDGHRRDGSCEHEVRDYGDLDCSCPGLRLCAACEGDPEAHDMHVCGREYLT